MPRIAYRKIYRVRLAVPGKKSYEVTFPRVVVEKEALKHGITTQEFLKRFHAIAQYNNFEGVHYIFEEINDNRVEKKGIC